MIDISIHIPVDDWRAISGWLWRSLATDETDLYGHLLLECEGRSRRWVATDTAQLVLWNSDGDPPRGPNGSDEPFSVAINPRLFRGREPQDATLVVSQHDDRRTLKLLTGDVSTELPEHPGQRVDWREPFAHLSGTTVRVETDQLRDALDAASAPPFGADVPDVIVGDLWFDDGRLRIQTPWSSAPSSSVAVVAAADQSTPPCMFDLHRIGVLLMPVSLPTVELVLPAEPSGTLGIRAGDYEALLKPCDPLGTHRRKLEELLCEFLGVEHVERDDDGDYPLTGPGDVRLYVRIFNRDLPTAEVFSVIASGVEPDVGLFQELNAINANAPYVKLLFADGAVMAEIDLVAETLDQAELSNALWTVRRTTEQFRDMLSIYFGGAATPDDVVES